MKVIMKQIGLAIRVYGKNGFTEVPKNFLLVF